MGRKGSISRKREKTKKYGGEEGRKGKEGKEWSGTLLNGFFIFFFTQTFLKKHIPSFLAPTQTHVLKNKLISTVLTHKLTKNGHKPR